MICHGKEAVIPAVLVAAKVNRSKRNKGRWLPALCLLPSAIAVLVFIYFFILFTGWTSLSRWNSTAMNLDLRTPVWATYAQMFVMPRWQCDLRNVIIFTALFLSLSICLGLLMAILLDRKLVGHTILRNVFLFPYALSFIVTGVAWRWVFNPEAGINLLFNTFGLTRVLSTLGVPAFKPGWITDSSVVFPLNDALAKIFPGVHSAAVQIGLPLALIPVVIAACWQLSGFAMAMYIAGLSLIPAELREAARIDGASGLQVYTKIILPQLTPVTISLIIILGHVSLKIFDLVFAMTGPGPGFVTDMPGIFVFEQTFKAIRYNTGAAASIVMLALVAIIIVPYFWGSLRSTK